MPPHPTRLPKEVPLFPHHPRGSPPPKSASGWLAPFPSLQSTRRLSLLPSQDTTDKVAYAIEICLLIVLEAASVKLRCRQGWLLVRPLLLVCRWLPAFSRAHGCPSLCARTTSSGPVGSRPTPLTSFNLNFFLAISPYTVPLGVKAQYMEFGVIIQSTHQTHSCFGARVPAVPCPGDLHGQHPHFLQFLLKSPYPRVPGLMTPFKSVLSPSHPLLHSQSLLPGPPLSFFLHSPYTF